MAERSYPFDSGPGATINEDQWSYLAGSWQDDGVEAPGPWDASLKLTSSSEALILHIGAGHANISGIHYHLDAPKTLTFASNATSNPRIDRVVLKLDRVTNTIAFLYKQGTPATTPIAPIIDRTWASPEINIGTFIVRASSSTVLPAECFDQRDYIGRYVKVTEDVAGQEQGTIAYQPSVGKFFAKGASTIEIGAVPPAPDLTPYLTKSSASSTYSTLSHTHSSGVSSGFGGLSWTNGFSRYSGDLVRSGTLASVNLVLQNTTFGGFGYGSVPGGVQLFLGNISSAYIQFRPTNQEFVPCTFWNKSSGLADRAFGYGTAVFNSDGTINLTPLWASIYDPVDENSMYYIHGTYQCRG